MKVMNSKLIVKSMSLLVLVIFLCGTVLEVSAQRRRRPVRRAPVRRVVIPTYTVPADTVIRVRLNQQLSSRTARVGDRFSANVTEPVHAGAGVEVIPVSSKVWGRVTSIRQAGRRTPGQILVAFNQVALPNGRTYTINGSLSSLQTDDVNSDNEGSVTGGSNRKRDAVFIGGGAATGAIIGAIAGGGKGAGIGAIIGGALGTGARVYEKEQHAEVKSGTEFGVILNRSVTLPAAR